MSETEKVVYESVQEELDALEVQVQDALVLLRTERQRRFVLAFPSAESGAKAMIQAGYEEASAARNFYRVKKVKNVERALSLVRRQHQLAHGIDPKWKRQMLTNIAEQAASIDGGGYQPNAAVRSVEILAKMDGDIVQQQPGNQGAGGITINISTGIPDREAVTIAENVLDGEVISNE